MHFYYQLKNDEVVGPVTEEELAKLYTSGEVTNNTLVIEQGGEKWSKYEKLFWTPPPIKKKSSISFFGKKSERLTDSLSDLTTVTWDDAKYKVLCPSCQCRFKCTGKLLTRDKFTCPTCGEKMTTRTLRKIDLVEGLQLEYRVFSMLFSPRGRVSPIDYWLFFALPAILLHSVEPAWAFFWMVLPGMPTAVKRLQDLGLSGQWMWIPMMNFFLMIFSSNNALRGSDDFLSNVVYLFLVLGSIAVHIMMGFVPGQKKTNRYGPSIDRTIRVWR